MEAAQQPPGVIMAASSQELLHTNTGFRQTKRLPTKSSFLVGDEGDSQLLVHHKRKDSHLCGTALVQLNGTLLQLGLLIEGIPSEVEGVIAEVTDELSSGD